MIALIALLVPIVLGASWEEKLPAGRTIGGYFALLLVLESTMMAVFAATDVFVFYVAFELMLIPMYFLIGAFGGPRRTYAATKFFLYSLFGGLMMLASVIGLYVASKDYRRPGRDAWTGPRCARSPTRSRSPPRCGSSPGSPSPSRSRRRCSRCTAGCPTPARRPRSAPAP